MANSKEHAHELIDRLPPAQLSAVVGLLEAMLDPVAAAISRAGIDEEAFSVAGISALDEAKTWTQKNASIPHEQFLAELGIHPQEIEQSKEPK